MLLVEVLLLLNNALDAIDCELTAIIVGARAACPNHVEVEELCNDELAICRALTWVILVWLLALWYFLGRLAVFLNLISDKCFHEAASHAAQPVVRNCKWSFGAMGAFKANLKAGMEEFFDLLLMSIIDDILRQSVEPRL